MSLAETALAEITETPVTDPPQPVPGSYEVKSTGTPMFPLDAEVDIVASGIPGGKPDLVIDGVNQGGIDILPNGDFVVIYKATSASIQFRQSGADNEYLFGAVIPEKVSPPAAQDDPPITGVWGAEARPPQSPGPYGEKE